MARCQRCTTTPTRSLACSFERLVRLAIRHRLLEFYEESPTLIRLHIDGQVVEVDPPHARMLLCNRLRFAGIDPAWTQKTAAHAPVACSVGVEPGEEEGVLVEAVA